MGSIFASNSYYVSIYSLDTENNGIIVDRVWRRNNESILFLLPF